jgi:hypothetical protein
MTAKPLYVMGVLMLAGMASAQRLPENYSLVTFRKVPAGKTSAYIAQAKNHAKKIAEARIQRGEAKGWALLRLTLPYATGSDHNFVSVYYFEKLPNFGRTPGTEESDALAKAAGFAKMSEYNEALREFGETVHGQVLRGQWRMGSTPPGSVIRVNYYKVPEGGMADAMEMEERIFMPMLKADVDRGTHLTAWSLATLVMPYAAEAGWNYITAATYKDWASMMSGPSLTAEAFAKVHPGRSYLSAMDQYRHRKKLVKSRTYEVIDTVGAPVGAK